MPQDKVRSAVNGPPLTRTATWDFISFPRSRVGTHTAARSLTCGTDDRQIGIPTLERGNEKAGIRVVALLEKGIPFPAEHA
jgi:hypothetical protein